MKSSLFRLLLNLYPPYLGAGIRVKRISPDYREIDVEMRLRFWNKNYVGTHFGGSLYAMCDPFFMLMLIKNLGPGYIVWDKAAEIRFRRPGRGLVRAEFRLSAERVLEIRKALDTQEKLDAVFSVNVTGEGAEIIAELSKTVYVRRE